MGNEITQMVETCLEYIRMLPSQPAEKQIQTVTSVPMEVISMDLGKEADMHYLIRPDHYSGWPFVSKLSSLITKVITDALDEWFLKHGRPQHIWSDGGTSLMNGAKIMALFTSYYQHITTSQMAMPMLQFVRWNICWRKVNHHGRSLNTLYWNGEILLVIKITSVWLSTSWGDTREPKLLLYKKHSREFRIKISKSLRLFRSRGEKLARNELHHVRNQRSVLVIRSWSNIGEPCAGILQQKLLKNETDSHMWLKV